MGARFTVRPSVGVSPRRYLAAYVICSWSSWRSGRRRGIDQHLVVEPVVGVLVVKNELGAAGNATDGLHAYP